MCQGIRMAQQMVKVRMLQALAGCVVAHNPQAQAHWCVQVVLIHLLRDYRFTLGPGQVPLKLSRGGMLLFAKGLQLGVVPAPVSHSQL